MNPEHLFELIRGEEAVLWAGSGLSLYAGYPSGTALSKTIYNSLSPKEKLEIPNSLSLPELTEQYVRIKGNKRDDLIRLLRQIFTKKPSTIHVHEKLARIPHIRTIVTTNYDRLFEMAYSEKLLPIIRESDLGLTGKAAELFKVHGDIGYPETMVVTKSDYANFDYQRFGDNLFWSNLKARISNKAIVFIGYDLEDENIKNVLRQVVTALGENRKEMFLIAPGFKKLKVDYLADLGIQYHDSKGEIFIDSLFHSIKEKITTDFDQGKVGPETVRKFFNQHGIAPELGSKEDGYYLKAVKAMTDQMNGRIAFKSIVDGQLLQSFNKIMTGQEFGTLTLDSKSIEGLQFLLNDINMLSTAGDYRLQLQSQPHREGRVSIVFEDGSEFEGIEYQLYLSKELAQLTACYQASKFIFKVTQPLQNLHGPTTNSTFSFEPSQQFNSVNAAISTYKLGLKLAKNLAMTIYHAVDPKPYTLKLFVQQMPVQAIETNLQFFEWLKKIQSAYHVRFDQPGDYTADDYRNAMIAAAVANGQIHVQDWTDELTFEIDRGIARELVSKLTGNSLTALAQTEEEIFIYGQTINLGYKTIRMDDLVLINKAAIERGRTNIARVRPASNIISISYSPELSIENNEGAMRLEQ